MRSSAESLTRNERVPIMASTFLWGHRSEEQSTPFTWHQRWVLWRILEKVDQLANEADFWQLKQGVEEVVPLVGANLLRVDLSRRVGGADEILALLLQAMDAAQNVPKLVNLQHVALVQIHDDTTVRDNRHSTLRL